MFNNSYIDCRHFSADIISKTTKGYNVNIKKYRKTSLHFIDINFELSYRHVRDTTQPQRSGRFRFESWLTYL